jgi:predicted metal-dependent HD superfamily phosphohydrolase
MSLTDDLSGKLNERFKLLWTHRGANTPQEETFSLLHRSYSEAFRTYHNVTHLCHCLEELDTARHLAIHPAAVEIALWFHDAVYEPLAKDNEARSAAWAEEELRKRGAPQDIIHRVKNLILATKHDQPPTEPDAQLIVDIDLAILGQPAERFDAYEAQIRQEYAMVPEVAFRQGRAAILEMFLNRPTIYYTDFFQQKYEGAARANLQRSLYRLLSGGIRGRM